MLLVQNPPVAALAQGDEPPVVDILGRSTPSPPASRVCCGVSRRSEERDGSSRGLLLQLDVRVSEEAVEPTVALNSTGLAVVMVIDRGGIARRNDPRGRAVDLASALLDLLALDGSPNADGRSDWHPR